MSWHHPALADVARRDPRYPIEAYEFVLDALEHSQKMLQRRPPEEGAGGAEHHVSGRELLEGVRDLARQEFGLMARVVFRLWGIDQTDDVGEIVFNLIDAKLLAKTETDRRADFHQVYDLDTALAEGYTIAAPAPVRAKRGER
jgi:uncharacterized repeat protein (TIGR04138 family)